MKLRGDFVFLKCSYTFFLTIIFLAGNSHAQAVHVDVEPAHSQVQFTLGATLHTVHGTFKLKSGAVQFDPSTGKVGSGEIVIDATSGDSGNAGRDRKMHETVLESAKYPEIVFVPRQIQGEVARAGDSHVQIEGVIRLHGAEHAVVVPVTTQMDGGKLSATAEFTIPYVAWGLKDPSTFVLRVEKVVHIKVQLDGKLEVGPSG